MNVLIWFRRDLRLHDHPALQAALQAGARVIPVYCFDPREFGHTAFGFTKTGPFRAQFLRESVEALRAELQQLGSDLVIRPEKPEIALPAIARQVQAQAAYWHDQVTSEETQVAQAVTVALQAQGLTVQTFWSATLIHPEALPGTIADLPDVFTHFRQQVERHWAVRPCLPCPRSLPPLPPELDPGPIPDFTSLGMTPPPADARAVLPFHGGEAAGLVRLQHYIWHADCLKHYKQTRNGLLGADYSSKLSPWLALGCLSPRQVYEAVRTYEAERVKNESTYWLIFELLWRDYFHFLCAKYGDRVFYASGLRRLKIAWKQDWPRFDAWRQGRTGYPFVDANLRELAATGFMSNRGRQNVASFLSKNLGIDWRMGAEWFESLLIDYDVCSNWGNWNYVAGVGTDARGFRYFNILKQARDYDPHGHYVKHWLPELASLPAAQVHRPWQLDPTAQARYGVRIGVDYPHPIVDLEASVKAHERLYQAALPPGQRQQQRRSGPRRPK